MTDVDDILSKAKDAMQVRTVYGEPIQSDGVIVIPAARIRGGGGGGSGKSGEEQQGSGGGFGLMASPAGAFVIRDGMVRWKPALDVNRIIFGGQLVAIVALLTIRSIAKARAKAAARK